MDDASLRFVENLVGRLDGPLHLRLIIQPAVAVVLAARDGWRDAKSGKPAYGWAVLTNAGHRREILREGWKSIGKVFLIALLLDAVYQLVTVRWFYLGEALLVALCLSVVPYSLLRGPFNRVFAWVARASSKSKGSPTDHGPRRPSGHRESHHGV